MRRHISWLGAALLLVLAMEGTAFAGPSEHHQLHTWEAGSVSFGVGDTRPGGSERVRAAQHALRSLDYGPGPIDGIFGARTEGALRRFQQVNRLERDGIAGGVTLKALQRAVPSSLRASLAAPTPQGGGQPHAPSRPSRAVGRRGSVDADNRRADRDRGLGSRRPATPTTGRDTQGTQSSGTGSGPSSVDYGAPRFEITRIKLFGGVIGALVLALLLDVGLDLVRGAAAPRPEQDHLEGPVGNGPRGPASPLPTHDSAREGPTNRSGMAPSAGGPLATDHDPIREWTSEPAVNGTPRMTAGSSPTVDPTQKSPAEPVRTDTATCGTASPSTNDSTLERPMKPAQDSADLLPSSASPPKAFDSSLERPSTGTATLQAAPILDPARDRPAEPVGGVAAPEITSPTLALDEASAEGWTSDGTPYRMRLERRSRIGLIAGGVRVSVVIPTLNEAMNLPHVLGRLPDGLHEVIIVDGRSADDTVAVARRLRPDVRVLMQMGRGKGNALSEGFAVCTGDIIVMVDADGSTDPAEIPSFVAALSTGADFVKGSRFAQGGASSDITLVRTLGNRVLNALVNGLYGTSYTDLCYGYNAFWRRCLPYMRVDCDGFEVETLINVRIAKAGLAIREVPSFESERLHGQSNLKVVRDGIRVLRTIALEHPYVNRTSRARRIRRVIR